MNKGIKIIFIFLTIGTFGFLTYSFFGGDAKSASDPLLSSGETGEAIKVPGSSGDSSSSDSRIQEVFGLLSSLQNVNLNTAFFDTREFTALSDFSEPLPAPTNIGRPNPFAPIGTDIGVIAGDVNFEENDEEDLPVDNIGAGGNTGDNNGNTPSLGSESNLIVTNPATAVARTSAVLGATLSIAGTPTKKYFAYGTTAGTTLRSEQATGTGNNFSTTLTGLTPNTTYFVKALIEIGGLTFSSQNSVTFKTAQ